MSPKPHRLGHLPLWFSRWLGYRPAPIPAHPNHVIWLWSFIGGFCGISVIQAIFSRAHYFVERDVPSIVASYGASAVLIYGAVEAPLAQPRALVGGHFIGALVGTCITKLFLLLPPDRFEELSWLAGSLSCATAIVAMQMTATSHPPAGATALLAAISPEIRHLSWYYLPVVLLSSMVALAVALVTNNIQRRYPVYWNKHVEHPPHPTKYPHAGKGVKQEDSANTTITEPETEERVDMTLGEITLPHRSHTQNSYV